VHHCNTRDSRKSSNERPRRGSLFDDFSQTRITKVDLGEPVRPSKSGAAL
jgi:hypothetical protein